jgi:uncharacterized iron-regulated protein
MKKIYIPIFIIAIMLMAMKSDKEAFKIFDLKGKKSSYEKMLKEASEADIVFFGELHNNPVCHWLQIELTKDLYDVKGQYLVLAAEMFESDEQLILDEYTSGKISTNNFESQARLWPNYETDYKPLVEFARDKELKFVASNVPRRYASIVFREGFEGLDSISKHAKYFMPPLPIPYDPSLPGYQSMVEMGAGMGGHGADNLPRAQALKDATMAYFILENMEEGSLVIHYNGTYHSNDFEGIIWYLNQYRPDLNIISIASVEQAGVHELEEENEGLANFTIAIPESMTKTH